MDDLMTWLRAQLDDDERTARACSGNGEWDVSDIAVYGPGLGPEVRAHMARHDPDFVLRRVRADRQIIELHARVAEGMGNRDDLTYGEIDPACRTCGVPSEYARPWPCKSLCLLALPYAHRAGYREEWKP